MKINKRFSVVAIAVATTGIILFQNCAPAKISSSENLSTDSATEDLGSSAPPSSTPTPGPGGSTPTPTPNPGSTPVATPTPITGPAIKVSTTLINFGNVRFGSTSPTRLVTVTNTGSAELRITQQNITGGVGGFPSFVRDSFETTCRSTLAAGQSCDIGVYFDAFSVLGSATGMLQIVTNAPNSPTLVQLEGRSF